MSAGAAAGFVLAAAGRASAQELPAASLLDLCRAAFAHVTPDTFWTSWSLAPQSLVPLLIALGAYLSGAAALRRASHRLPAARAACFILGWTLLAIALLSPLCRMSAGLASAHMVQHAIIAALAPPLLILGSAGRVMAAGLPRGWGAAAGRALASVAGVQRRFGAYAAVTVLYGAAIWAWHAPALYEAVLQGSTAHVVGYAGLIAISLAFWSGTVSLGTSGGAGAGAAVLALLITTIHTGFLGALLTLSQFQWFASATGGPAWGLSPLEDQQLAGLVMWVPMAGIFLAGTLWILYRAIDAFQRDSPPGLRQS